jgi:hypothetical protein
VRRFWESWKKGRAVFAPTKNDNNASAFVTGCDSFRKLKTLRSHEKSDFHL